MILRILSFLLFTQPLCANEPFPYGKLLEFSEVLGHKNRKNIKFKFNMHDKEIIYQTNEHGHRDKKGLEKEKVLVVGASWTFGLGVSQNQIWSELLEDTFCDYSFYNISVPGYTIDQIYLSLKEHLKLNKQYSLIIFEISPFQENALLQSPYSWSPGSRKPFFKKIKSGEYELIKPSQKVPLVIEGYEQSDSFFKYFIAGYNKLIKNYILFKKSNSENMEVASYIFNQTIKLASENKIPIVFISHDNQIDPIKNKLKPPFGLIALDGVQKGNKINEFHRHLNHKGHFKMFEGISKYLSENRGFSLCKE